MNSAIEVRGLCKHYRDFSLRDVSFTVPGGSIMGFIGENGAGKTTTIKSILGLLHTDGGSISVLGRDPVTDRRAIGQDIGVVLDGSFFYEGMRAKDISAVMSRLHSRWDKESFASYCERFALPMEKPFKEFSKGMRAKLALTTALAHHPKLLVLDEATSGLDPVVRSEMLDLFLEFIQDEEHSILLSSHITSDLEKVADYITFIHAGKIVFSKTKDDILEQYGVVKCEKARAAALDGAHILGRRDSKFDAELLGTPLEEADIINRFEIRLRNERAYYAVRDLLTYYDAEQTAFSIINQYVRFVDEEPDKRKNDWKLNDRWAWFIGDNRQSLKLTTKPEPYTLDRTLRWVQRQVAPTLKMLKKIDKGNGTDYMETIEQQAKLTEKHEMIIKQQTTPAKDLVES